MLEYVDIDGLHNKADIAIERLRTFAKTATNIDPEGYYVCDSGGKDSSVIKQLCLDAGVPFAIYHHHTTADHPETVYFVRREKKRFEDMGIKYEITHNCDSNGKRITMWSLIEKQGFPTQLMRFCCVKLKEYGGDDRMCVLGVRKAESVKRQFRGIAETIEKSRNEKIILNNDNDDKRDFIEHCLKRHKVVINPIIDWEDEDVWEYIETKNIPYNPLYDLGFKRIGCVGCPMGARRAEELEANPKYKQMYLHAIERFLDAHEETRERYGWTAQQWYDWWVSNGKAKPEFETVSMFDDEEGDEE